MAKKVTKTPKTTTSLRQGKYLDKKLLMVSGALFAALALAITVFATPKAELPKQQYLKTAPITASSKQSTFAYRGQEGIDALTLLRRQAAVTVNTSGLVTGINGRLADTGKREFWAFLVNGKEASVGPKVYVTKAADTITWKIETY